MKKCVINLATRNGWYPDGQRRLVNLLKHTGFDGDVLHWIGERSAGAPMHTDVPYGFKPRCMMEALNRQYDLALWLDCSVQPFKSIDPVFAEVARKGYHFESCGWMLGQWATDISLQKVGITRDEAMNMTMLSSGMVGLDLRTTMGQDFVRMWLEMSQDGVSFQGPWQNRDQSASPDPRCLGHRHDQTAASIIAHRLGMEILPPTYFEYWNENPNESCVALLRGGV